MDQHISSYLSAALIDILDSNFQLKFLHNLSEAGQVDDKAKYVAVNTKGKIEDWFPAFVHEYCHFKQWKENKFIGKKWDETFNQLYEWIDDKIELSKQERMLFASRARRAELDCERRAVQEILKYNLPINRSRYIQKANAYIFSYGFLVEGKKELYNNGRYDSSLVYNLMPKHFLTRYDRLPKKYREMIIKLSEEEE